MRFTAFSRVDCFTISDISTPVASALFFLKQKSYYPGCDGLPWHFTGSVAAHFEEVLREAAKSAGCETGEIAGDPMERLIVKQNRQ